MFLSHGQSRRSPEGMEELPVGAKYLSRLPPTLRFMTTLSERPGHFGKDYVSFLSMPDRHTAPRSGTASLRRDQTRQARGDENLEMCGGSDFERIMSFKMP